MIQFRNMVASLLVAALFAWAMSTKFPTKAAIASGVAAGVFNYAAVAYLGQTERRPLARRDGGRAARSGSGDSA
jgi:hypothetical protein